MGDPTACGPPIDIDQVIFLLNLNILDPVEGFLGAVGKYHITTPIKARFLNISMSSPRTEEEAIWESF